MPWVRLDDGYDDHRKVVSVGWEAAWLNIRAIMWCNRNESDGHMPVAALGRFGTDFPPKKRAQLVARLVQKGLWHEPGHECDYCPEPIDEYVIHDYLDYQLPKSRRDEERSAARERMANARANKKTSSGNVRSEHPAKFAGSSDNPHPHTPKDLEPRLKNLSANFDEFWAVYPRRIAKQAARQAWQKRIRDGANPDELIAGATIYATWSSRFCELRFVKHPATWLNNGCETDELEDLTPRIGLSPTSQALANALERANGQ